MDRFLLSPLYEKKTVKMSKNIFGLYEEFKKSKKTKKKLKESIDDEVVTNDEDKYGLDNFEGIKYSDSFSESGYEEIDAEDYNEDDEVWELDNDDEEESMSDERYNEIKSELEELVHQNVEGEDINGEDSKELVKQYAKSLIDLTDDCHGNESYWSAMVDKMTDEICEEL